MREWLLAGLIVLGIAADIASRYWGAASELHITAGQMATLTDQVHGLTATLEKLDDKIGTMPRTQDVVSLAARADRQESEIGDMRGLLRELRSDVNHLTPPATYPNMRN